MPSRTGLRVAVFAAAVVVVIVLAARVCRPEPAPAPAALAGQWRCVAQHQDGKSTPDWLVGIQRQTFTFAGDRVSADRMFDGIPFARPDSPAGAIDFQIPGDPVAAPGTYAVAGDRLTLRIGLDTADRPAGFATAAGDRTVTFECERIPASGVWPETAAEQLGAVLAEASADKMSVADRGRLAARSVAIADTHPGTDAALLWTLANAADTPAGPAALAALEGGGLAGADLETLARCLGVNRGTIGPGSVPDAVRLRLAPAFLDRVRRTPDHPAAAAVLCEACFAPANAPVVPPAFDAAARMIADRYAADPAVTNFLETLGHLWQRPWAARYEPAARAILAATPDAYARHRAAFTLAKLVAGQGEARQAEARDLFARVARDADPAGVPAAVAGLVEGMRAEAGREVDAMLVRGVGGPAPPLAGIDLDGKPMALADYRGKVVLLAFWASWCQPCMKMVPHERDLVARYEGRPFAVVGVNGDDAPGPDPKLFETLGITWRSFRNEPAGGTAISRDWNLTSWPTFYLIDPAGVVRRRWIGTPPPDELDAEIARRVAAAEGKTAAPGPAGGPKKKAPAAAPGGPATLIEKIHAPPAGDQSKYVVAVPANHDGTTPLPVILFLHGSGQCGTDNAKPLAIGLGPAVRKTGMPFPFVAVFPQCRGGSWLADGADGKQAMAILADVERDYATDPRRVYLTGVSMGGEGVWSLAAAHPGRFAAIVPVCGGGDPATAGALKGVPCWAFHGDADEVVPVSATRDVVRAVTAAGGRPLYQEYRGVGHDCWDRVYADADLYRWLRDQVRR